MNKMDSKSSSDALSANLARCNVGEQPGHDCCSISHAIYFLEKRYSVPLKTRKKEKKKKKKRNNNLKSIYSKDIKHTGK